MRSRSIRSVAPRSSNILEFPEHFSPPAHVVTLEENYRSTQPVLDAANALMADGGRQYRKYLRSTRGGGAKPRYVTVQDDQAQADYVVERVLECRERGIDAASPGRAVPQLPTTATCSSSS